MHAWPRNRPRRLKSEYCFHAKMHELALLCIQLSWSCLVLLPRLFIICLYVRFLCLRLHRVVLRLRLCYSLSLPVLFWQSLVFCLFCSVSCVLCVHCENSRFKIQAALSSALFSRVLHLGPTLSATQPNLTPTCFLSWFFKKNFLCVSSGFVWQDELIMNSHLVCEKSSHSVSYQWTQSHTFVHVLVCVQNLGIKLLSSKPK